MSQRFSEYLLHFPANPGYAHTYLAASGRHGDTHALQRLITAAAHPLPKLADRAVVLTRLDEAVRHSLIQKERRYIDAMHSCFPMLTGETLQGERVEAVAGTESDVLCGALVYIRRTDFGELAIIDTQTRLNFETGVLDMRRPQAGTWPVIAPFAKEPIAYAAESGLSIVRSAINVAAMTLFAAGPAGIAAATALNIFSFIFGLSDDSQAKRDAALLKNIETILQQDKATAEIQKALTHITTYTEWLAVQPSGALINNTTTPAERKAHIDSLAGLKEKIDAATSPNNPLLQSIGLLKHGSGVTSDPSFQIMALPVFMFGASVHLLFLRISLLVSTDATSFHSPIAANIANYAADYRKHIEEQVKEIRASIEKRKNAVVSTAIPCVYEVSRFASGGFGVHVNTTKYNALLAVDGAPNDRPALEPLKLEEGTHGILPNVYAVVTCGIYDECHPEQNPPMYTAARYGEFEARRTEYLENIRNKLEEHYNFQAARQKEIDEMQAELKDIEDTYRKLVPNQS